MSPTSCKHYNGDHHNKQCRAGVCYRDVTTDPDGRLGSAYRKPCVDWEASFKLRGLELEGQALEHWKRHGKCEKFELPSAEELAAYEAEAEKYSNSLTIARFAILDELQRRWKERDGQVTAPADTTHFYHPQKNYFCGSGIMDCPICRTGKLNYSRSSYNGHVRAACSTPECVRWIE